MKTFYEIHQNDSDDSFHAPAITVFIEASNLDEMKDRSEPHFTFCGDSGLYTEHDDCSCCPCCGHRWTMPYKDELCQPQDILKTIEAKPIMSSESKRTNFGHPHFALIKSDKSIILGDSEENLQSIKDYITTMTPEHQRIAIAEVCGWRIHPKDRFLVIPPNSPNSVQQLNSLPNYLSDLNAMHEAEKELRQRCVWLDYLEHLGVEMTDPSPCTAAYECGGVEAAISATASQRAEAFLRALNLWTE